MPVLATHSMAAVAPRSHVVRTTNDWRATATTEDVIVEAWGQGFVVGALIIMTCITIANMRHGILLHKLILAELLLAMSHGTFCFMGFNGYGWYLSSTAALLYISSWIHNWVAWLKIRPFFNDGAAICSPKTSKIIARVYLVTPLLSIAPLSVQIVNNFEFFNNINNRYLAFRPYETLMRDPWWIFACIVLFHVIRKSYGASTLYLIKSSPRFAILLTAIILAMIFTVADIIASVHTHWVGATDGINPWWKMYLVFKCLTDTIMLDDFKTELDRLSEKIGAIQTASWPLSLHSRDNSTYAAYNPPTNCSIEFPSHVHSKAGEAADGETEIRHVEHIV